MKLGDQINYDYLLKYVLIGDSYSGKSQLLATYRSGPLNEYQLTIDFDFCSKNIQIGDKIFRLHIWDTTGQECFRSITRGYYKNSVCALLLYKISYRDSFDNLSSWIEDIKKYSPKTILIVLVGFIDNESKRAVSFEEGEDFAEKNGMMFFEASEKDELGINEIFLNSAKEISKRINQGYYDLKNRSCEIIKYNSGNKIILKNDKKIHLFNNQGNDGVILANKFRYLGKYMNH